MSEQAVAANLAGDQAKHMDEALVLAARGRATTHPNPRVGCVIVQDGEVVGRGFHIRAGEPHAEVFALREAGERARGADVYVTLEPCNHHGRTPPCTEALIASGVRRVFVAMIDPNPLVAGKGLDRLREAGIEVHRLADDPRALTLNRGFVSRMRNGRPWVTLKLAASLDGRTAMSNGESKWITGAEARADVHRLRAEAGAVLTSAATVIADDSGLDVRDWTLPDGTMPRQPDRIVLDSDARVRVRAKVWAEGARRFWISSIPDAPVAEGVEPIVVPRNVQGHANFDAALSELGHRDVNEVFVECGATLAGALLASEQVDELVLYLAPQLLGHEARPLAHLPGLEHLHQRLQLKIEDARTIGGDLRITATFK